MSDKLTRFRGDTYAIEAVLTKDNVPIDLVTVHSAILSFTKGSISERIPGVNGLEPGEVSFPFPTDIKAGTYKYDIQVTTTSNGEIRTYVKDVLEILGDITI